MLSDEARRGWRTWCRNQGVTLTGFLEAFGKLTDERGGKPPALDEAVLLARVIDDERKQR